MKTIYFKDGTGKKVYVKVSEEIAEAMQELRRSEWRNEAYERYYRGVSLSAMSDRDEQIEAAGTNPEDMLIDGGEKRMLHRNLNVAMRSLTPMQAKVLSMLQKGIGVREIAKILDKDPTTIRDIRKAIQKKFEKYL